MYMFSEETFTDVYMYTEIHIVMSYFSQDTKQISGTCQNANKTIKYLVTFQDRQQLFNWRCAELVPHPVVTADVFSTAKW